MPLQAPSQYPTMQAPQRWPLVTNLANRDSTPGKDAKLINCYAELNPITGDYWVEKRPARAIVPTFNGLGTVPRNMFFYSPTQVTGNLYAIFDGNVYVDGVLIGVVANAGSYFFQQIKGGANQLVFVNGINRGYFSNGVIVTQIVDPDFPASIVDGIAYLDGTFYVMTPDARIFGSAIDDPINWTATNVIPARSEPDGGVAIRKHLNYVLALKQWTTEVFYDAGNPPPGSPLLPVQGALYYYGCLNAASIQQIDGDTLWVASGKNTQPQVVRLSQLNLQIISTPPVERILQRIPFPGTTALNSFHIKLGGHRFYCLNIQNGLTPAVNLTLVYDMDQNLWYEWYDPFGTHLNIQCVVGSPVLGTLAQAHLDSQIPGEIYRIDTDYVNSTDGGTPFPVDIYTPNMDFGVNRIKLLNKQYFNADQTSGSMLQVRCSDDDYQTWSNFRPVDLSKRRPYLSKCGSFYRRAYHYRHFAPTAFRIRSTDLEMDLGVL